MKKAKPQENWHLKLSLRASRPSICSARPGVIGTSRKVNERQQFAIWITNRKQNTRVFLFHPIQGIAVAFVRDVHWITLSRRRGQQRRKLEWQQKSASGRNGLRNGIWSQNDMSLIVHCIVITTSRRKSGFVSRSGSPLTVCSWKSKVCGAKRLSCLRNVQFAD